MTLSGVRVKSTSDPSAADKVFAFITFKTSDIEDLQVLENADAPVAVASAAPEPAPARVQAPQQQQQKKQQRNDLCGIRSYMQFSNNGSDH